MFAVSPVIELVNVPIPEPSEVWLFETVGLDVVAQHTPRAVTDDPPIAVILPPDVAEVTAIAEAAVVVTVGNMGMPVTVTLSIAQ